MGVTPGIHLIDSNTQDTPRQSSRATTEMPDRVFQFLLTRGGHAGTNKVTYFVAAFFAKRFGYQRAAQLFALLGTIDLAHQTINYWIVRRSLPPAHTVRVNGTPVAETELRSLINQAGAFLGERMDINGDLVVETAMRCLDRDMEQT